ncbi:MAG: hypothetical protein HGA39_05040 [Coriobacteriia bacterium]|nr:hypothetical protein [Coriobacteriia bacterium]
MNKARTSPWTKGLIIVLIVAFVSMFMATGIVGLFDLFKSNTPASTQSAVQKLAATYDPQVTALKKAFESNPTSFTAAVNLANTYFDYAQELSTPATGQSSLSADASTAAAIQWANARAAYDAASKIKSGDPSVETDRSAATYYSGDTTAAVAIVSAITVSAPSFAPAWLNLGIFAEDLGQNAKAIAAYQQYLKLDPTGSGVSYANGRITALKASTITSGTP